MKKIAAALAMVSVLCGCFPLRERESGGSDPVGRQLYSFSPLAQVYLNNLGLEDRNGNGVIDRDAGEGYEQFAARYGNADTGFFINGVTQSANNGRLEENEIINHYYINIRFNPRFANETNSIERERDAYIYANNIPLVWLDDRRGTVMNAVNNILGVGWQERTYSEDEAVRMFERVTDAFNIRGLTGDPNNIGYFQLPEFARGKTGYCFEAAQFGFCFFSQLRLNSAAAGAMLTPALNHAVIKLTKTNDLFDYFGVSKNYTILNNQWRIINPLQSFSEYYVTRNFQYSSEQAVIYNKYSVPAIMLLMETHLNNGNYHEIISLGDFMLANTDIDGIMASRDLQAPEIQANLEKALADLLVSYSAIRNRTGFNKIADLLNTYFRNDPAVKSFIERYRF